MSITPLQPSRSHAPGSPRRHLRRFAPLAAALTCVLALVGVSAAGAAEAPVGLGTATSFAILAGAGITNTGATTITGDVGSYATTAQTGFGTVVQTGVNHAGDAVTQQGKLDLVDAYNDAAGRGPATASVPVDLAGQVLTPGVYNSGTIELSGSLTLDAQGDPNAVFVFQAASTLITASASSVNVINGGPLSACNIYWKVGSSATLGSGSSFVGTVLASDSISLDSSAVVQGRLLAQTGAVTLINNTITNSGCAALPTTPTTTPPTTVPGDTSNGGDAAGAPGADGTSGTGNPGDSAGTPTGDATPPTTDLTRTLAFTGVDRRIPILGTVTLLAGLACVALSRRRLSADR
jgi:Ice-binding-like